jgi:hypothetical protein
MGVPRCLALGLILAALPAVARAQTIRSYSIRPAEPTTGDPVILSATIDSTSSCNHLGTTMSFGLQDELGPAEGWAIDVRFASGAVPVLSSCPIVVDFGPQPIAAGGGVLRLWFDGVVADLRFFSLEVRAGPAPGWEQPALHGGYVILTRTMALASVPGRLAIADTNTRQIVLADPLTGQGLSAFAAPGNGDVRGLAWDGAALYVSVHDTLGPRVYKVDLLGRVLDSFPSPTVSPTNPPLEGLAFLGGVLFGTIASPPILYAINPSTRQKVWERSLPFSVPALDAAPEGLIAADSAGTFHLLDPTPTGGERLLGDLLDNGLAGTVQPTGLAYDGNRIFLFDASRSEVLFIRTFAIGWALDGTLHAYVPERGRSVDVVRGDVERVVQLSGYLSLGPTTCLLSMSPGGVVDTSGDPPEGRAFFYLARFRAFDDFPMSYGRTTLGFRRIDDASSCP